MRGLVWVVLSICLQSSHVLTLCRRISWCTSSLRSISTVPGDVAILSTNVTSHLSGPADSAVGFVAFGAEIGPWLSVSGRVEGMLPYKVLRAGWSVPWPLLSPLVLAPFPLSLVPGGLGRGLQWHVCGVGCRFLLRQCSFDIQCQLYGSMPRLANATLISYLKPAQNFSDIFSSVST